MGAPRPVQDQDPHKARHQGRQEGGLRQGDDGEGEAGTQGREGLPGEGPEGQRLSGYGAPSDVVMISACMTARCPWALRGTSRSKCSAARKSANADPQPCISRGGSCNGIVQSMYCRATRPHLDMTHYQYVYAS